jgi:alpha,alpha-trehalase
VELTGVFADSKQFADALATTPPAAIREAFERLPPGNAGQLRDFVERHFSLASTAPDAAPGGASPDRRPIGRHIDALWDRLLREPGTVAPYSSLLALPHPYIVPGGRFREIYYWDSYFTLLGLASHPAVIEDMVANIAYLIDSYGHMPNGNRTYYLSRSQPPFFFAMVGLLTPEDPASAYAAQLRELRAEYAFWMDGAANLAPGSAYRRVVKLDADAVLNRYWDDRDAPRDESYREDVSLAAGSARDAGRLYRDVRAAAESGWDFSSRWLEDGRTLASIDTTEILPVDLNSILYGLERAIRAGCGRRGDDACAREFAARAARRKAAMDRYLWDADAGCFRDYRWSRGRRTPQLSAATVYPLFFGVASRQQAAGVAHVLARELLKRGGLVTTPIETGQQWDAPNGWAPLQWLAVSGLRDYGYGQLARRIARRFMSTVLSLYRAEGRLVEKYDVVHRRGGRGGEYPLQDGFGWTNGVMVKLLELYPDVPDGVSSASASAPLMPASSPKPGGAR